MSAELALDFRLRLGAFALEVRESLPAEGVTAVFGPSGCGKSTLLRVIAGLERRAVGRLALGEAVWQEGARFVPPHRRGVGFVFQDARLFPHLDVAGNLAFAQSRAGDGPGRHGLAEVVAAFDLGPLLSRRVGQLSGGERQRVAIARTLVARPRLLAMDEPLAALDERRKAEILPAIERLRDAFGVPILYVSHSATEVARLATRIVALREGRVVAVGPPQAVLGDVAAMGARDLASVLHARVVAHHPDGLTELATPAGALWLPSVAAAPGDALRVRIAAQEVILSRARPEGLSALNILAGEVSEIRPGQGPGALVVLKLGAGEGGDRLVARVTRRSAEAMGLAIGQTCHAVIKSVAVAPADIGRESGETALDAPPAKG